MERTGYGLIPDSWNRVINIFIILILYVSFLAMVVFPVNAISSADIHKNITMDITSSECRSCHFEDGKIKQASDRAVTAFPPDPAPVRTGSIASIGDDYTAILTFGQTPYQLGPFFRDGANGWSWWDAYDFGNEMQKNLIGLMILNKTTNKPLTGLSSKASWPQASYRRYSGIYSYKADTAHSPITSKINYPDQSEIWMIRDVDLTAYQNANLTFWTWYSMEKDWDYGYVAVSLDGTSWTNLPGTLTTTYNPNGNNLGNGITGNTSDSWIQETMNLSIYSGNKIFIAFIFKSDAYVNDEGWYVDDINVSSGSIAIYGDDSEHPKILNVNVTYPHLTLVNATDPLTNATNFTYTQQVRTINMVEDMMHPGTYIGYFKYDPFAEQYSGNYTVTFDTFINGSSVNAQTDFQTTIFGCQGCHNKKLSGAETSFIHGEGGGMQSCTFICHSGSRGFYGGSPPFMGPPLTLNPMHVHEMKFGHNGGFLDGLNYPQPPYNVESHVNATGCSQCHTSFIHDNIGQDTAKIGSFTLHGTNISFSSGTHENLTCEYCHGSLAYPEIPEGQYQLQGSLGNYTPSFTSHESFTDTYIINVNRTDNITLTVTGDNTSKSIEIYTIGPVDNTSTALQGFSSYPKEITASLSSPVNLNIPYPYKGTWIVKLIQIQDGAINYTISSNFPVQKKPVIKIPECNNCHNRDGSGLAYTPDQIPSWNPGFAHADINNDGTLDVQCRMCHGAMHNITIKDCKDCHSEAPAGHPIKEPSYGQYNITGCLECHGDPHKVSFQGSDCITCHSPGDVNISLFGRHANINTSDGQDNVTNNDCSTCHYEGDMDRSHVYLCESCHLNETGIVHITDPSLIKRDFMHGQATCKICHAPVSYHLGGSVGPLGLVEKLLR